MLISDGDYDGSAEVGGPFLMEGEVWIGGERGMRIPSFKCCWHGGCCSSAER